MLTIKNNGKVIRKLVSLIFIIVAISPAIILFYYITAFGVDVPYYDTWGNVPYIDQMMTGKFQISSLFDSVGPHKSVTSMLTTILIVKLFHWDTRVYYLVGFCYQVLTGWILYKIYWRQSELMKHQHLRILGIVPVFLCLFSLRQQENSLASWSISFYGGAFFSILTFYAVDKMKLKWFILAIFSGILGSLTFITGVLVWPIGLLELATKYRMDFKNDNKRFVWYLLVWIIFGVVSSITYFFGTDVPSSSAKNLRSLILVIQRFFVTLGASLSIDKGVVASHAEWIAVPIDGTISLITGIIIFSILIMGLVLLWKKKDNNFSVLLAIILFGLGAVGMTAVGRIELGLQQAMSSRYTTYSSIVVIGAYLAIIKAGLEDKFLYRLSFLIKEAIRVFTVVIIISSLVAIVTELYVGPFRKAFFVDWADNIKNYSSVSDDKLVNPHFSPQQIRDYSRVLDEYQLSVFRK